MAYSSLIHLKTLLMVLTAAGGTVTGGVLANSYVNSANRDPGSFLITLNPSTMWTVQGASSTSIITVTSINGFSGTVTLSLYFPSTTFTASISPTSVSVLSNSIAESTLSVTAPDAPGSYTVVVIGVSSSHGKTSYSSSMLTVQAVSSQDFKMTSMPTRITTTTGATNTTTIIVTSINGYTGNVSLTVTAPFGFITVTGGENPLTITSGGAASSTLAITTSTNTGKGTITLQSYVIRDSSGNAWSLSSWIGPSIEVNAVGSANIMIGASCPGCIYNGIAGLFLQYQQGQTYTVTVTTSRDNQFTFTVTD